MKKKQFKWEAGNNLPADEYEPVKEIREVGFSKLADGLYADPALRKKQRKKKLVKPVAVGGAEIWVEESESRLHRDIEPSDAAKVIHKEPKGIKGIQKFISPYTKKKPPQQ